MNQHHHNQHHHDRPRKALHKDWRLWVIGIMLVAMLIYVFTFDEQLTPAGAIDPAQKAPAAAGP